MIDLRDMSTPELCALVRRTRYTIHADIKSGLLPAPERRAGCKAKYFRADGVRRYLKHKFPEILRPLKPHTQHPA